MSSKATQAPNEHRVSGQLNCRDNDDNDNNSGGGGNSGGNGGGGVIDNRYCFDSERNLIDALRP